MNQSKFFLVSWAELHRDTRALAWSLIALPQTQKAEWKGVIAVTRGGMVPAAVIARELGIRLVETVCISSYDEQDQGELHILKGTGERVGKGEGWLVVDDLVDTGSTFKAIREMAPAAHFAAVYAKPLGKPEVDSYVTEVSQDTWIHFPWDLEETFTPPLIKR